MAFAVEVARGSSISQAAITVGISTGSGYRWARKPEVRKSEDDIRSTVLQTASYRMVCITGRAIDTLEELLGSESEKIRLSAARIVLNGTVKMRQLAELEQELQQIREIVASTHNSV
jgi:hypothetical protein